MEDIILNKKYYMILNKTTGKNEGFYITGQWTYDEILNIVERGQELKEISEELWTILIGGNNDIKLNNPVLKIDKISDFLKVNFNTKTDIKSMFFEFFENKEDDVIPNILSQQERDILYLANLNKMFIDTIIIENDNKYNMNNILVELQNIIDRYSARDK